MDEEITLPKASFSQFGKPFQEKIVQALLVDQKWAEQVIEVLNPQYFELNYLKYLAEKYFAYSAKYKVFPTQNLLITIIKDDLKKGKDTLVRDQIVEFLIRIKSNPNLGDLEFVKDKALDFCRKQALKAALESAVDFMESEKYEEVVNVVKKAVMVGTTPSVGHEFFNDFEARFTHLQRDCISTGFPILDSKEILNGGLGKGELCCVVANTGVGKSHFLVHLGCEALRQKKNVIHYTFELSETQTGIRYDSNLCDIESTYIIDNRDDVMKKYGEMDLGRLYIKQYPPNHATVYTIRAHIERLMMTKDFIPDLIIIDYADIMKSSKQYDSLRHELKLVYEELRGMAIELNIPIATASQSNKEGSNADVVDLSNMSEAYGKAMVADCVVTLSRKPQEKALGIGRLFVAKNRAGKDGLLFNITIDTARSKFTIIGQGHVAADEPKFDAEADLKKQLRNRMKDFEMEEAINFKTAANS